MTSDLKRSVNEHLERCELDEKQLRQLEALQTGAPNGLRRRGAMAGVAAALLVGLLVLFVPQWMGADLSWEIADEAAMNHLKRRPLEVRGIELAKMQPYFGELPFRLIDPSVVSSAQAQAQLLGGRYCSVRGVPAAQLRLHDPQGRTETLYQVPYDANRFGDLPDVDDGETARVVQVRGLSVDLWVEKGLLFARVRE